MKSLAQRSISAAFWNFGANGVVVVVLFLRSILLARLLPVAVFGAYGFATAVVGVSAVLLEFGLNGAFMHRAPETRNEDEAAAVHFTLKFLLAVVWLTVMLAVAWLWFDGLAQIALVVLSVNTALLHLTHTPSVILRRRVIHRRLALMQVVTALATTGFGSALAWQGVGLWTLLAMDLVTLLINVVAFYVWRPVWRPRLVWIADSVKYFVRFGARNLLATLLEAGLTKTDDLWTGAFLGETALGYYSRAFRFATYPSSIVALPINSVAGGTYAELKEDRHRLSQAFFRTNALLVRIGFLAAGALALVAPEFIRLVLGEKWLPMLDAFRLMLIFTMLDPLRETVAGLFIAVGRPEQLAWTRGVQLAMLVAGLFWLGPSLGIVGVAVAVNVMTVTGIVLLLWQARRYVDISLVRLFAVPALGLAMGLAAGRGVLLWPPLLVSDWSTGAAKLGVFVVAYGVVLLLGERAEILAMVAWLRTKMRARMGTGTGTGL